MTLRNLDVDTVKRAPVYRAEAAPPLAVAAAGSASSSAGATAHNLLTGLGADDHPQYHNNARGDARYPLQNGTGASGSWAISILGNAATATSAATATLAASATQLATGRTLAITGDLAWTSPSFNGTANVTAAGTLASIVTAAAAGFWRFSHDAKGRVTASAAVTAADIGAIVDARYVLKAGDTMTGALNVTASGASTAQLNIQRTSDTADSTYVSLKRAAGTRALDLLANGSTAASYGIPVSGAGINAQGTAGLHFSANDVLRMSLFYAGAAVNIPTPSTAITSLQIGDNSTTGAAISLDAGNTRDTSALLFRTNQRTYSLLGGSGIAGPGIQARWDSATSNRYFALGAYNNAGTWSPVMTMREGTIAIGGTPTLGGALVELFGVETARSIGDTSFFSFYNSANTVRTGYLSAVNGSVVTLGADGAAAVRLYVAGRNSFYSTPTRNDVMFGGTAFTYSTVGRRTMELVANGVGGSQETLFAMLPNEGSAVNGFYLHNQGGAAGLNMYHQSGPLNFYGGAQVGLTVRNDGRVAFTNNTWQLSADTVNRLYFGTNAITYIAGGNNSGTQVELRRADGGILAQAATDSFRPGTDNAFTSGTSGQRWSVVYAATGTINTSDERQKTDIVDEPLRLDFVRALRPVQYRWKDGSRPHHGLIAQDVKAAIDFFGVDHAAWTRGDPKINASRQGLRYEQFISSLIASVQDLADKLEAAEARITDLENR